MRKSLSPAAQQSLARTLEDSLALHRQGRLDEAEKGYARILKAVPEQFDALNLLGMVKLQRGKAGEALRLLNAALKVAPNSPDALANLGLVLNALHRPADALASCDKALAIEPRHIEALGTRGLALAELQRPQEALACFDQILAMQPQHVPSRVNRANALIALGQTEAAIGEYDAVLAVYGGDVKALFNRAGALFRLGRYAESLAGFDRLLMVVPQHAEALSSRGLALQALGRHQDALASYEQAIAARKDYADAHFNAALALLTLGDYARGFAQYEWRWKRTGAKPRSLGRPLWLGEFPLARKTILLHAEQGLGDTIQLARYAPLVARTGAQVVLEVQAELKPLFAELDGITVIGRGEPLPAFDVHCPLGSLPLAFKTEPTSVPAEIPYLQPSIERVAAWQGRLPAGKPRVAIAWSGNPSHINDRHRSIGLARLQPLLASENVQFVSVQRELRDGERVLLDAQSSLLHVGDALADFSDTAAVLSLCDLVISVDTSVAHLAGAMGRPLWLLLPGWPDWRWTLNGESSPWYPAARLFRQARGDWDSVIARVRDELPTVSGEA